MHLSCREARPLHVVIQLPFCLFSAALGLLSSPLWLSSSCSPGSEETATVALAFRHSLWPVCPLCSVNIEGEGVEERWTVGWKRQPAVKACCILVKRQFEEGRSTQTGAPLGTSHGDRICRFTSLCEGKRRRGQVFTGWCVEGIRPRVPRWRCTPSTCRAPVVRSPIVLIFNFLSFVNLVVIYFA